MMKLNPEDRAGILAEALPYIQEYYGETVVVKYGGNAMTSEELKHDVIRDIVLLHLVGIKVVLVHGGGPDISALLKKINKKSEFVNGLRYTDEETMDVVQMVLCGKVNKNLVTLLDKAGGRGVGLGGMDGGLFRAVRKVDEDGTDYGLVGEITEVHPKIITDMLEQGFIPVVSSVAAGIDADTNYNINADIAAEKLAIALKAKKLILLTDVRGLMRDPKDDSTLIPRLKVYEVPELVQSGIISGGMIPKVEACLTALSQGAQKTSIIDGRLPHSLLLELFTSQGIGTEIVQ